MAVQPARIWLVPNQPRRPALWRDKEPIMDDCKGEQTRDSTADDKDRAEQGRKNREAMDEPPPHGTDPLHEGP
jgi:hypothetical protein